MDRHATAREEELIYDAGYADKVLAAFINNGQLVTIPAKLKKQRVVLDYIVQRFEPGRGRAVPGQGDGRQRDRAGHVSPGPQPRLAG